MTEATEDRRPLIYGIIGILVVVTIIILYFVVGVNGMLGLVFGFFKMALVAVFIGIVVYLVYTLFFKPQKIDVSFFNKEKLVKSAKLSKPRLVRDLYLSGDRMHPGVKLGRITGYARIQILEGQKGEDASKGFKSAKVAEQDVFTFKKSRFPLSLFEEDKVLRVSPEAHSQLLGDVILDAISIIKLSEYFYLNDKMLQLGAIDYTIGQEALRSNNFLIISELGEITMAALGANPQFQKQMQAQNTIQLPNVPQRPPERPAM